MTSGNEPSKPSSEHVTSSLPSYPTGFQATPPAPPPPAPETTTPSASDSIPLPPTPEEPEKPMTAEELGQLIGRLDGYMPPLVLALAFLVACFTIRNSDFLMHLATGRFLATSVAEGKLGNFFGYEPFSHTTEGVYWTNHSWLYDLVLYGLFLLVGAVGLVIVKGVLSALLAWVMFQIRRPGQSLWASAACTGLAVLTLSPQLNYRPAIVSFLFLGVTLWLLTKPAPATEEKSKKAPPPTRRHLWLLPPLFVLWVNMDSWFILGPITVGLYLLGEKLQESLGPDRPGADRPSPDESKMLVRVLVVGVLVCLLNPHHIRAFSLPAQLPLAGAAKELKADSVLQRAYISPLGESYFKKENGLNAAGLAYYALIVVSAVSFALNGGPNTSSEKTGWRWWRGILWLAFLALSLYHHRTIPFFAVVAGPIAALNFQDFAARSFGLQPRIEDRWKNWSISGRAVTLFLGAALLVLAWPGWLFGVFREERRVSWGLAIDPSLQQVAESFKKWRADGTLGDQQFGLNLTPEVPNYLAWFCPEEKGFFDQRTQPFKNAAADYVELRKALHPPDEEVRRAINERYQAISRRTSPKQRTDYPWQKILRERKIRYVIFNSDVPLREDTDRTARWMLADPEQWTPIYLGGRTLIMRWNDPAEAKKADETPLDRLRFDPQRMAYGPEAVKAPDRGPERLPNPPREWWEQFLYPAPSSSGRANEEEAATLLKYFNWQADYDLNAHYRSWKDLFAAGMVGFVAPGAAPLTVPVGFAFRLAMCDVYYGSGSPLERGRRSEVLDQAADVWFSGFRSGQDDGPAAALWLAVRSARRAVADNPDDGRSYLHLFQAYSQLQQNTRERRWVNYMPLLAVLRRYQTIHCLKQAVAVQPNHSHAHYQLAQHYRRVGFFDLALKHLEEMIKYLRETGPDPGVSEESFNQYLKDREAERDSLNKHVQEVRVKYEVGAATRPKRLEKAMYARMEHGLFKEANDDLRANVQDLNPDEIRFLLELTLDAGDMEEVRGGLKDDFKGKLGPKRIGNLELPAFEWFQIVVAAATGDYRQVEEVLQKVEEGEKPDPKKEDLSGMTELVALLKQRLMYQQIGFWLFFPEPHRMPGTPLVHLAMSRLMRLQAGTLTVQYLDAYLANRAARGNLRVLRGMLALEHGDTPLAMKHFEECLRLAPPGYQSSYPAAIHYLKVLKENQEAGGGK